MKSSTLLTLCFGLCLSAAAQNSATGPQSSGQGPYSLTVTTKLVSLDIVVTDPKGSPVDDLKQSDFQIYEDKTLQTIRGFDAPSTHFFPSDLFINSTADLDKRAPNAPVTILVLDELNTTFENEAFTRYSIQQYLKTQPEHLTQPTELIAIDLTHLMVLRDYTTSKKEIENALAHHLQAQPWQLSAGWKSERFSQSFIALDQVAKAVAGHPGHKNMLWVGQGLPTIDTDSLPPDDEAMLEDAIAAATNELRDSRVTLYTIDPSGVPVTTGGEDENGFDINVDPFGSSVDLNAMAKATGGLALYGRNDVDNMIGESVRDGSHFYTLSYRPESSTSPDRFRSTSVVVDKPGLTATTRQGYYVQPPDTPAPPITAAKEKEAAGDDLLSVSENELVYDGMPIQVRQAPDDPNKLIVHIPAGALAWQHLTDGPGTAEVSLVVATFDQKGKMIKRDAKLVKLHGTVPNAAGIASDPSVDLTSDVNTAKPVVRLRVAVRSSQTGRIGAENLRCAAQVCKAQ